MAVAVKICGLSSREAVDAAVTHGASYLGFVFFPRSPRNVMPEQAAALAKPAPAAIKRVALLVNPEDAAIDTVVAILRPDILQLHGGETPDRAAAIRQRTGLSIMKAIPVASSRDLEAARSFEGIADRILFDAKPPKSAKLPGGNAVSFDWTLLTPWNNHMPWMLAGGLTRDNLHAAVTTSGADTVDVSSGVETAPGQKDPEKIKAFLTAAAAL